MSLDEKNIKEIFINELNFTPEEVDAYIFMLKAKEFSAFNLSEQLKLDDAKVSLILDKFMKYGLIIRSIDNKYKCLHPRMGLTNVYKIWEQDLIATMRRKRAKIELLVRNLTSKFENNE
jgi:Sugar-specific transcriptional regulator TrmB.